ncbi:MAG TPA: hypothetical protein VKP04_05250 [Ktedonobacteraceae bacterium]|nr:hypothetical protein [Ktedonobacteraceae bacterium]
MTTASHLITDEFEQYHPLLFSIAYRMLGSASEVNDSQIRVIRGVLNPDKLGYIRRQLEARQRVVSQM